MTFDPLSLGGGSQTFGQYGEVAFQSFPCISGCELKKIWGRHPKPCKKLFTNIFSAGGEVFYLSEGEEKLFFKAEDKVGKQASWRAECFRNKVCGQVLHLL